MLKTTMSKPGPKFYNQSWKKQYNEHDVRGANNTRRVTFKHSRFNKKGGRKDWSDSIRAHLEDEDVVMGSSQFAGGPKNFHGRNRKGNRPGSPAPNRNGNKRKLLDSPSGWFRVFLPYGNKYSRDFVVNSLLQRMESLPLIPVMWGSNGNTSTFFVEGYKVAEKLHFLDKQIQCPDGYKLIIRVSPGSPNVDINSQMKEKMKLAMAKRYNAVNKALDLTKFHTDPDLQNVFCTLFKPVVLLTAIEIISENIPEIEALNFYDNRIQVLSHLKKLEKKLPNLKILHLGANKIRDMTMLDSLSSLPIVDLVLNGNPVCDKYKDQNVYIR